MSTSSGTLSSASAIAGVLGLAATLATGVTHSQTAASGTLEEIVVTAERRVESVQKVGASISVRNGEDLLKEGKFSLASILENVPGVTGGAASGTAGTLGAGTDSPASGLVIRGIPSNVGAGGSTTSTAAAAAIYVDGVYSGVGGNYDIDRVEVLRGPQGTLYGRSATSGLVAIHTNNPDLNAVGGNATVEAGNYNLRHYTAVLNLPVLNEVLGVRIAGNRYQRDGFIDAEGGAFRSTDGKIKVLYKPNDAISLLVGAALQNNVNNSGGNVIGNSTDPKVAVPDTSPIGSVKRNSAITGPS
jgi:iron complex outermembrane receptor protein